MDGFGEAGEGDIEDEAETGDLLDLALGRQFGPAPRPAVGVGESLLAVQIVVEEALELDVQHGVEGVQRMVMRIVFGHGMLAREGG